MRSESLDAAGPDGTALRVQFRWRGDRFGHTISLVNSAAEAELLESLEGTPADAWPPSPPLQSLHRETLPDGRTVLLLVGAAGRGHWSASIEAVAGEAKLIFDIACRHGDAEGWLGNRYLAMEVAASRLTIGCEDAKTKWTSEQLAIVPAQEKRALTTRWRFSVSLNPEP